MIEERYLLLGSSYSSTSPSFFHLPSSVSVTALYLLRSNLLTVTNSLTSGLDWALSHALPKAPNCRPGFAEGVDTIAWTDLYCHFVSICNLQNRPTSALVSGHFPSLVFVSWIVPHIFRRFQPPRIDLEKSSIDNSENTSLFLFSCYQYILASIILSVGPPFRKPLRLNGE